ncbi:MAG: UDP-3-O-(3-hydroxymyristoyl)glucosamine N-acyltransferase [Alphaproteobacteria bacterium]|nr:UDP-3-O-(3-hydroxymyristoyl)glucosamine N-acyltransferase [Alphaproteobacteria bacterium]
MVDTNFYNNNGPFTLQKIAESCEAKLADASKSIIEVRDIASMENAGEGEICFFYDKKAKEKAANIKATACVTTEDLAAFVPGNVVVLTVANPKLAFLKLNSLLYSERHPQPNTSSSARIHPSAIIGENCFIGENVVIGKDVKIGKNCVIEHNAVIDAGCVIGDNNRIGVGAHISYCRMGSNCYIFSGARIGQDGFGFMMVAGQHKRIPQVGLVIIGNDVEVGANTCIDRGALDNTVIGDGCRIDNLVQIAHNDKLGKGCVVVSQTGIAGSCTFGDYVVCGGQTGFADHLTIGSGAQIGAQSGIMRDIEPGSVVMGYPAVPIKDFMRQVSFIQKSTKK